MNAIELMVYEHGNIKKMLEVLRKYCFKILKGEEVEYNDLYKIIDFVRNYADKHHHGKEEQLLFNKMVDELGNLGEKLVKHGMLVEHDLGRLYIGNLEEAVKKVQQGDEEAKLDLIGNAIGYIDLLNRHIQKEDDVVYKFAERNLKKDILNKLDEECVDFERKAKEQQIQEKYINLIEELSKKVR
ncbi:hemerythrin domain-containing protein [Clostridium sp. MB40-C1]|uniref:hemerythrin domain-containing protein n=1 Tax=Clostridium sp. MB40-C1 TaxID=3070996 RepID=UPI0027E12FF4|nr:hemerythrin domain-containing protein [Clostridium sp. MB40-C1]WMJ82204.1 hemerythrin domain-containing protein [Clostridium sp. MB40-C1]